VNMPCVWTPK